MIPCPALGELMPQDCQMQANDYAGKGKPALGREESMPVVESPAGCSRAVLKSERLHNVLVAEHQCPVAELQEVFGERFPNELTPGEALQPPPQPCTGESITCGPIDMHAPGRCLEAFQSRGSGFGKPACLI